MTAVHPSRGGSRSIGDAYSEFAPRIITRTLEQGRDADDHLDSLASAALALADAADRSDDQILHRHAALVRVRAEAAHLTRRQYRERLDSILERQAPAIFDLRQSAYRAAESVGARVNMDDAPHDLPMSGIEPEVTAALRMLIGSFTDWDRDVEVRVAARQIGTTMDRRLQGTVSLGTWAWTPSWADVTRLTSTFSQHLEGSAQTSAPGHVHLSGDQLTLDSAHLSWRTDTRGTSAVAFWSIDLG